MNKELNELWDFLFDNAENYCDDDGVVCSSRLAQMLYDAGYRKTIWHKVADGDLPKRDSKDICAVPVQVYYIDRNGIEGNGSVYFFFIDNTFHSLGYPDVVNVIAWTELPKYEG